MTSNSSVFRRCLFTTATRSDSIELPETEALLDLVERDARRQRPDVLADLFAKIKLFDIRPLLSGIRVPTLIAGGNRDPIISYEHTCELAAEIRGAELVTFRNVGHLFFVECPNLYYDALDEWIGRHCEQRELRRAA